MRQLQHTPELYVCNDHWAAPRPSPLEPCGDRDRIAAVDNMVGLRLSSTCLDLLNDRTSLIDSPLVTSRRYHLKHGLKGTSWRIRQLIIQLRNSRRGLDPYVPRMTIPTDQLLTLGDLANTIALSLPLLLWAFSTLSAARATNSREFHSKNPPNLLQKQRIGIF